MKRVRMTTETRPTNPMRDQKGLRGIVGIVGGQTEKANHEEDTANDGERARPKIVCEDDEFTKRGCVLGLNVVDLADGLGRRDKLELELERVLIHSRGGSISGFGSA
jgi:hypothetical protein